MKFKPQTIYVRMQSFLRRNREESTYFSLQHDSNLLFVFFAYMFKGDLKNERNKFADVILKTELMIMRFNASNLIHIKISVVLKTN